MSDHKEIFHPNNSACSDFPTNVSHFLTLIWISLQHKSEYFFFIPVIICIWGQEFNQSASPWPHITNTQIHPCTLPHLTPTNGRPSHPRICSTPPQTSPPVCWPPPPRPQLAAITTNLPAANALVLAILQAASWVNVLLPWHQVLVALGSSFGRLAVIILPFITSNYKESLHLKTYKIHNGLQ